MRTYDCHWPYEEATKSRTDADWAHTLRPHRHLSCSPTAACLGRAPAAAFTTDWRHRRRPRRFRPHLPAYPPLPPGGPLPPHSPNETAVRPAPAPPPPPPAPPPSLAADPPPDPDRRQITVHSRQRGRHGRHGPAAPPAQPPSADTGGRRVNLFSRQRQPCRQPAGHRATAPDPGTTGRARQGRSSCSSGTRQSCGRKGRTPRGTLPSTISHFQRRAKQV